MNLSVTLLLALSLSLDAFAVAVTGGVVAGRQRLVRALHMAVLFGAFQAIMPVVGWATGNVLSDAIRSIDHWVAFALLVLIGSHMIYESVSGQESTIFDPHNVRILLVLSLATSIDALATGISLAFMDAAIIPTAVIIGLVTFMLSFIGCFIGDRIGKLFGNKVRIIGGLILIGIGLRILIEHVT
jgi:putative Mn2+ efflux pump MntP